MPVLDGYCHNFWKKDIKRLNQSFIETEIKSLKSFDLVAYCSKNPETLLLPINVPKQQQFTNLHDFIVISLCLYNAYKTWVFANKTMKELRQVKCKDES